MSDAIDPPSAATPVTKPIVLQPSAEADMAMYAAIVGKLPDIDPTMEDEFPVTTNIKVELAQRERPWSPVVLSLYLREVYRQGAMKLTKPEIAAWIRKQSLVARKRLLETQTRLAIMKNDRAA